MTTVFSEAHIAEGEHLKEEAHEMLEAKEPNFLLCARHALALALLDKGFATADDVHLKVKLPAGCHPSVLGAVSRVFSSKRMIREDGTVRSERPRAHRHRITRWDLVDYDALILWIEENPLPPGVDFSVETELY